MKKKVLRKFYEVYNINFTDEQIINFLKEQNVYKEQFENIQLKEVKDYVENLNISKDNKRISKRENKEKEIFTLKKINDKDEVIEFIKEEMKKKVRLKEENIEKIRSNFNYKRNAISNFSTINIKELFDFDDIICRTSYKKNRYRLFIKIDYVIIYMSIFDIIEILYDKKFFKYQVEYLYNLFRYEEFDNKVKDKIIQKEEDNKKFLKEQNNKLLNRQTKVINYLMSYERNSFDPKNRDKKGNFYFFLSKQKLAEDLGISSTRAQDILKFLLFLNIIKLVPYNNIELEDEIRINKENKYNNVNLYRITYFDREKDNILENLIICKEQKISTKTITEKFLKKHFPDRVKDVFNKKVIKEEQTVEEFLELLEEDIKLFESINL